MHKIVFIFDSNGLRDETKEMKKEACNARNPILYGREHSSGTP